MTPEEANPRHMIWSEIDDPNVLGGVTLRGGDGFTAKETAEIAKAFRDSSESDCSWDEWMAKFEEWSK